MFGKSIHQTALTALKRKTPTAMGVCFLSRASDSRKFPILARLFRVRVLLLGGIFLNVHCILVLHHHARVEYSYHLVKNTARYKLIPHTQTQPRKPKPQIPMLQC